MHTIIATIGTYYILVDLIVYSVTLININLVFVLVERRGCLRKVNKTTNYNRSTVDSLLTDLY